MRTLALALAAAAATVGQGAGPPALNPHWSTVLAGEEARSLTQQCSRPSPGHADLLFAPTAAEIAALEAGLAPLLATKLAEYRSEQPTLAPGDYYRQYAGFVVSGRRKIYVNGFHRHVVDGDAQLRAHGMNVPDWRHTAERICDGGWLTFGVEYDPATKQLSNFAFNGALRRPGK